MDPEREKELPGPVKTFYKGEPWVLGITQILLGILTTLFGVVLHVGYDFAHYLNYVTAMTPHWNGVLFIISGSLSVAAARNPKASLVKGMLGMNVVSSVVAGVGIIALSFSLEQRMWWFRYVCFHLSSDGADPQMCHEIVDIPYKMINGILGILLLFNILELGISISSAAFGCRAICNNTLNETVVVIYQSAPPNSAVGTPVSDKDVLNH